MEFNIPNFDMINKMVEEKYLTQLEKALIAGLDKIGKMEMTTELQELQEIFAKGFSPSRTELMIKAQKIQSSCCGTLSPFVFEIEDEDDNT